MGPWAGATDGSAGLMDSAADGRAGLSLVLEGWGPCSPPPEPWGTPMPPRPAQSRGTWSRGTVLTLALRLCSPKVRERVRGSQQRPVGHVPRWLPAPSLARHDWPHHGDGLGNSPPGQVQPPSPCRRPGWQLGWSPSPGAAPEPPTAPPRTPSLCRDPSPAGSRPPRHRGPPAPRRRGSV